MFGDPMARLGVGLGSQQTSIGSLKVKKSNLPDPSETFLPVYSQHRLHAELM